MEVVLRYPNRSKNCTSQVTVLFKVVTRFVTEKCKEVEAEGKSIISLQSQAVCLVMFPMDWASYILLTQKTKQTERITLKRVPLGRLNMINNSMKEWSIG